MRISNILCKKNTLYWQFHSSFNGPLLNGWTVNFGPVIYEAGLWGQQFLSWPYGPVISVTLLQSHKIGYNFQLRISYSGPEKVSPVLKKTPKKCQPSCPTPKLVAGGVDLFFTISWSPNFGPVTWFFWLLAKLRTTWKWIFTCRLCIWLPTDPKR